MNATGLVITMSICFRPGFAPVVDISAFFLQAHSRSRTKYATYSDSGLPARMVGPVATDRNGQHRSRSFAWSRPKMDASPTTRPPTFTIRRPHAFHSSPIDTLPPLVPWMSYSERPISGIDHAETQSGVGGDRRSGVQGRLSRLRPGRPQSRSQRSGPRRPACS